MSDSYKVIYSPKALDDIRSIYSYIAFDLKVPDTAQSQVDRIRKEIRSLDFMPLRYSIVDWEPWRSMEMHKIPVDNFVIYYTVSTETFTVSVIRIFYGGQDAENIVKSASRPPA